VVVAGVILALASLLIAPAPPTVAAAASAPFGFLEFSIAFMTRYWFHFEVATVLLLIGIVAAWAVISQRG
jgi:NADH:ubiquinone oxidoreductase subunit 6 (subunit J)